MKMRHSYLSILSAMSMTLCSCSSDSKSGSKDVNHTNNPATPDENKAENTMPPPFLYKVITTKNWKASHDQNKIILTSDDYDFIHLATDEQLEKVVDKYWKNEERFIILKIDTAKLPGKLVLEANPEGKTKYYHLYEGSIPLDAVEESKLFIRNPDDSKE